MKIRTPAKVLFERSVEESPIVASLRRSIPAADFSMVDELPESAEQDFSRLEVSRFRGKFLKSCPGTRHYHCCGYKILNFGVQCSLGCSYCILQAYLNQPNLRLFANTDDMFAELDQEILSNTDQFYRVGTGEFTDSLLLDPWTGFSSLVVPHFAGIANAILELKTKTDHVSGLERLNHGGRTIVSWSMNAPMIRSREEAGTATIRERLKAARLCSNWGYFLGFHFDPIIEHPGWRKGYRETIDRIFDSVDASKIVWISMGGFRFMPDLGRVIRREHPKSRITSGEFIRGLDNKMRYFRDIRVEMYAELISGIQRHDPGLCIYLCMESDDVWRESAGFSPEERGGLGAMLDRAVEVRMGIGRPCSESTPDSVEGH